ncbi:hypothetical protein GCM10029992_03980 [Glycomyces albus]
MRDLADAHRPDWVYYTLRVTIYTGQGGLLGGIALAIAAILALRGRSVRPCSPTSPPTSWSARS